MNQNGYISYCRFIVKGCNFCFCFFVIFLCKLNFTTRQSILASFLVYLVLAQDSGFFGPNSSDISITVSLKVLAPPPQFFFRILLVEVGARHQEKVTVTSGQREGFLFCVGLLAVLKGAPLPQSPTLTPMVTQVVSWLGLLLSFI